MVSKFPVTGQYGEYKVDIELKYQDDYGFGEIPFWEATVKKPIQPKKFFKFEDKVVYKSNPILQVFEVVDYISVAKEAVLEYEEKIKRDREEAQAKKAFEQWDGKVF